MRKAMTPDEWRATVGDKIKRRRLDLGYKRMTHAAEAAGISSGTWQQIESGRRTVSADIVTAPSPGEGTVLLVGRCLGWGEDWLEQLLNGHDPDDADGVSPILQRDDVNLEDMAATLKQLVVTMTALTAEVESLAREIREGH